MPPTTTTEVADLIVATERSYGFPQPSIWDHIREDQVRIAALARDVGDLISATVIFGPGGFRFDLLEMIDQAGDLTALRLSEADYLFVAESVPCRTTWEAVSVESGTVELVPAVSSGSCLGSAKPWVTVLRLDQELFEAAPYTGTRVGGDRAVDLDSIGEWASWHLDAYDLGNPFNLPPTTSTTSTTTTTTIWSDPDYVCDVTTGTPNTTGMPEAVAATLVAIHDAASRCDLRGLLDLTADSFTASFGGGTPEQHWSEELTWPERHLESCRCTALLFERLVVIAESTPGITDYGNSGLWYTWPGLFALDDLSSADPALFDELAAVHDRADFDRMIELENAYWGWRIFILEDGSWVGFVAGD